MTWLQIRIENGILIYFVPEKTKINAIQIINVVILAHGEMITDIDPRQEQKQYFSRTKAKFQSLFSSSIQLDINAPSFLLSHFKNVKSISFCARAGHLLFQVPTPGFPQDLVIGDFIPNERITDTIIPLRNLTLTPDPDDPPLIPFIEKVPSELIKYAVFIVTRKTTLIEVLKILNQISSLKFGDISVFACSPPHGRRLSLVDAAQLPYALDPREIIKFKSAYRERLIYDFICQYNFNLETDQIANDDDPPPPQDIQKFKTSQEYLKAKCALEECDLIIRAAKKKITAQ